MGRSPSKTQLCPSSLLPDLLVPARLHATSLASLFVIPIAAPLRKCSSSQFIRKSSCTIAAAQRLYMEPQRTQRNAEELTANDTKSQALGLVSQFWQFRRLWQFWQFSVPPWQVLLFRLRRLRAIPRDHGRSSSLRLLRFLRVSKVLGLVSQFWQFRRLWQFWQFSVSPCLRASVAGVAF